MLYTEDGQLNPHKVRSQKKQAKRQKKVVADAAAACADDSGSDFDLDTL